MPTYTSEDSLDVSIVEEVTLTVDGASGNSGSATNTTPDPETSSSGGGSGGRASGTLDTSNIDTLYVRFHSGGNGGSASQSGGDGDVSADGGDGGRGCSVRSGGTASGDVVIAAGGGGGGGAAAAYHDDFGEEADSGGGGADDQNGANATNTSDASASGGTGDNQSTESGGDGANESRGGTYAIAVGAGGGGGGGFNGGGGGGADAAAQDTSNTADGAGAGGGGGGTYTGGVTSATSTQGGTQNGGGQVEIVIEEMSLYAPTQPTVLTHSQSDFTVTGAATLNANTQTLHNGHPQYAIGQGLQAPVQSLSLSQPTGDATGASSADLTPSSQSLQVNHPAGSFAYSVWALDGLPIGTTTSETSTHQTLSLTTRVQTKDLLQTLRSLKSDEGKVDVLPRDDGGFVAVDRANGGNTYQLLPPARRQPLRRSQDVHVDRYEETLISEDVGEWDVTLDLVKEGHRTDTPNNLELSGYRDGTVFDSAFPLTFSQPEWVFETRFGEIQTQRVDADLLGTGEGGVRRFDVTARLTYNQAWVFEASLNRVGGSRVRDIPDAGNQVVDDTAGDVCTVGVDPIANADSVPSGEYVISEWESTRLNEAFQEVGFVMTGPV